MRRLVRLGIMGQRSVSPDQVDRSSPADISLRVLPAPKNDPPIENQNSVEAPAAPRSLEGAGTRVYMSGWRLHMLIFGYLKIFHLILFLQLNRILNVRVRSLTRPQVMYQPATFNFGDNHCQYELGEYHQCTRWIREQRLGRYRLFAHIHWYLHLVHECEIH